MINNEETSMITACKENINKSIRYRILSRFPALAYKNYRYFLFGQFISQMGTWIQKTAQQWVIYQLTNSPFILGLVVFFSLRHCFYCLYLQVFLQIDFQRKGF